MGRQGSAEHRQNLLVGLISAVGVTVVSLVFIVSFIGALHDPGPRSVPLGVVGGRAAALGSALNHERAGGYNVISYPDQPAARSAITGRVIDAALVPGPRPGVLTLLTASAVSPPLTTATLKYVQAAAGAVRQPVLVQNLVSLPASNPDGLSHVFFVVALLAPSLIFGQLLISRASRLHPIWQLAVIAVYAVIVAAVAAALADSAIGALIGAPWGIFGIGVLLAFAVAVASAAIMRWAGQIGYVLLFLLFIPVGIASTGTTLGPNMIAGWYADLGMTLPAGSAMPALVNTLYFHGNRIIIPLLVLSAWALAGTLAMVLAAVVHPPMPGPLAQPSEQAADVPAQRKPSLRRHPRSASSGS